MAIGITNAAILRRRRRGISTVITDFVAAELVWIDGPPTLNAIGATANSRAVVRNAEHQVLSALTPTYVSGTPANVTINSAGLCTAVANGTSVMTASYAGVTSITQTATVSQTVASISGVSSTLSTDDSSSGTFSPSGLDATGHAVSGATFTYSSDQPSILSVDSPGDWAGQSAGTAHITITASPGGATFIVTATVTHAAGLIATPSSFAGAPADTQQEAFTIGATDVTSDVIAYSSDETVATITSAPDQPTVGAGTNPSSSTLDIPVTGTGPYGGTPTTVALEVYNGTSWVRQTAVTWTGNKTATQTVMTTGLSASTDYTGKIRAVTITSAGESYPSSAIPSGTTSSGTGEVLALDAALGTNTTTNAANVTSWTDQDSGIVYTAVPGTGTCTYLTAGPNGKPAVKLTGNAYLKATSVAALASTDFTEVIVINTGASTSDQVISSYYNATGGAGSEIYRENNGSGNNRYTSLINGGGKMQPVVSLGSALYYAIIVRGHGDGTTANAMQIGGSASVSVVKQYTHGGNDGHVIGANISGALPCPGNYALIKRWNRALSDAEISTVVSNLNTLYGT